MINFNNLNYERLDYDSLNDKITLLINDLKNANNYEEYIKIIKKIINIQNHVEEMYDYGDIRNMRNLNDTFWSNEIIYLNEVKPKIDLLFLPFYEELINSKYKEQLIKIIPDNFFNIINNEIKFSSNNNIDLIKEENNLMMQYKNFNKIKTTFKNEEKSISSISSNFSSADRNLRKESHDAVNDFYLKYAFDYQNILFNLIKVRNKIAINAGFKNYTEYSLIKQKRFGYNYNDINNFRNNIIKYIIPICKILTEYKKEELNIDDLKYYDTILYRNTPELKLSNTNLLNELYKSFSKVDDELSELFNNMLNNNYIDFINRDGKVTYSITNYLTESCMPVITGNFKNNYIDIKTATHEMGHSFQKYCASISDKNYVVSPLLKYPNMEIAEMFSYAMEIIMMDKVGNLFNGEDLKKYSFMEINSLISTLPYICAVDEFQEILYSKENLKIEDINQIWLKMSKKYNLDVNNRGHQNLDNGGYYYRQSHIFLNPFYYIDYALSYFGALAIWNGCTNNIDLFKNIASVASYYSFKDLIVKYNMPNPFDEEEVKKMSLFLKDKIKELKM